MLSEKKIILVSITIFTLLAAALIYWGIPYLTNLLQAPAEKQAIGTLRTQPKPE
jgi:uncharacterized protein (DUF486 family)